MIYIILLVEELFIHLSIEKQGGRGKRQGGEAEGGRQCPPHDWPRQNVL